VHREPIVAYAQESCRIAAERMAAAGVSRLPVVDRDDPGHVIGIVTPSDLLKPRARLQVEEGKRERFIAIPWPRRLIFARKTRLKNGPPPAADA
jgi:chloride channel protein, CIC family